MYKKTASGFLALMIMGAASAQVPPTIQWQKALGGTGTDWGHAAAIITGGTIVVGTTSSGNGDVSGTLGADDAWVIKVSDAGTLEWQSLVGGDADDAGYGVDVTGDGAILATGFTSSEEIPGYHDGIDMMVAKLNDAGILQWQKALGGSDMDMAFGIQDLGDGGLVVVGVAFSNNGDVSGNHGAGDAWVVKLDGSGAVQWQKALGGSGLDWAISVQGTIDGGIIVVGYTESTDGDVSGYHGNRDAWVVKLNNAGTMEWQKALGGSAPDQAYALTVDPDGGIVVGGHTMSNDGDVSGNDGYQDAWVVKLDGEGSLQWQVPLGGVSEDRAYAVQRTSDGGIVFSGYTSSNDGDVSGNHGQDDVWVAKLDEAGTIQWQKALGGLYADYGRAIVQTPDGGFFVAGYSGSNNADVCCNHGGDDVWVVKLNADGQVAVADRTTQVLKVLPNPSRGMIQLECSGCPDDVRFTVNDALGRTVLRDRFSAPGFRVDLTALPRGLYSLTVLTSLGRSVERIIIEE